MSRPPETSRLVTFGDPVYREVEEHGREKLVLMQKVGIITHYPAWTEIVMSEPVVTLDETTMAFEYAHHPARTWGRSWWEKV
jgi:hypothetical protein